MSSDKAARHGDAVLKLVIHDTRVLNHRFGSPFNDLLCRVAFNDVLDHNINEKGLSLIRYDCVRIERYHLVEDSPKPSVMSRA
jgi:hypothetical protein